MSKHQRDALLALLASMPLFWWAIDSSVSLKDMVMIGFAVAIGAGVLVAAHKDSDGE